MLELVTGGELFDRIVDRGVYSEKDAARAVNHMLTAVAVSDFVGKWGWGGQGWGESQDS